MTGDRFTRAMAVGSLIAGCGFLLFNPLRLAFIANTLIPFLYFNLAVMLCCGLWFFTRLRGLKVRPVECVLVLLVLCTAALTDYSGRHLVDVLTDLLRPMLFIAVVVVFRNFVNVEALNQSANIQRWLRLTMWVTLLVVPACWLISRYFQPLYPAFSSIDSIFGMAWLLAAGNFIGQGIYLLILIASGKRGVYLAAFLILCLCYRNKRLTLPSWILLFSALAVGGLVLVSFIDDVQRVFLKGGTYNTQDGVAGVINILSGGRIEELKGAVAAMHSPLQLFFGAGLGFAYQAVGFEEAGGLHRNLHFTPASLAIYYGIPFAVVFFYYLATFFWSALRITRHSPGVVSYCYSVYCIASMAFLFTEFSVFAYVNFAISCGIVGATAKWKEHSVAQLSSAQ